MRKRNAPFGSALQQTVGAVRVARIGGDDVHRSPHAAQVDAFTPDLAMQDTSDGQVPEPARGPEHETVWRPTLAVNSDAFQSPPRCRRASTLR